jgi:hypothetical protein
MKKEKCAMAVELGRRGGLVGGRSRSKYKLASAAENLRKANAARAAKLVLIKQSVSASGCESDVDPVVK